MAIELTWDQVNAFRMTGHFLTKRAPRTAIASVISSVCGIQAQMLPAAQLQLWARIANLRPKDVTEALWASRLLLRTWCMRGTAHLIATEDFPLYHESVQKPQITSHKEWLEKRGLREFSQIAKTNIDPKDFNPIIQVIKKAMKNGPITRNALADIVEKELGPEARPWVDTGYYLVVKLLGYEGQVCFGPEIEGKTSIVLTKDWLPNLPAVDKETAENTILSNYLRCYGPATPQDFAVWSGLKMTTVKPIWERQADQLIPLTINEKITWILQDSVDQLLTASITPTLRLLPNFDIYLLAHKDKSHIVEETNYKQVFKKAAWIAPVILFNGKAIGTWNQKRTSMKLIVTVEPFSRLTEFLQNEIEAEAQRLGEFFDLTHEVKYS